MSEHVLSDGGVWQMGSHASGIDIVSTTASDSMLRIPDDLAAVRSIVRVDPPFDEEWLVVTLVLNRKLTGETPQAILTGGGLIYPVSAPPDDLIEASNSHLVAAALAAADAAPAAEADTPPAKAARKPKEGEAL